MGWCLNRELSKEETQNDWEALKEILNIFSHQGKAKQNNSEIPSYTCHNGNDQQKHVTAHAGEDTKQGGQSAIAIRRANLYSRHGNHCGSSPERWKLIYVKI